MRPEIAKNCCVGFILFDFVLTVREANLNK